MKQYLLGLLLIALGFGGGYRLGNSRGLKAGDAAGRIAGKAEGNTEGQMSVCNKLIAHANPLIGLECINEGGQAHVHVGMTGQTMDLDGTPLN